MTWRQRLLFACGQLGMMGLARFLFSWYLDYPAQKVPGAGEGATLFPAFLFGLSFLAFRILDGISDPLAGVVGDAWVRRGRERRSLLWFSFAVPAVGLVLIFWSDPSTAPGARWLLFLAGMAIFFAGYTFYAIPYWSLVNDYAGPSADERRVLSTLLGGGLLGATALIALISPRVISGLGYRHAALCFALPSLVLMALPFFAAPARARASGSSPGAPSTGLLEGMRTLFRDTRTALGQRRFLAFLLLFSGSQMAFTVVTASAPLIAERLLGGTKGDVAVLMGGFLGTAIPAFAIAPALSRRFGWERTAAAASVLLAVVYAGTGALGRGLIGSPLTTATLLFACGGPFAAALLAIEGEAITDCARERDGEVTSLYWGVFNFVVKALNGLAMTIAGGLADLGAIRALGPTAGALLVIGVLGYFYVRRREDPAAP